MFAVNLRKVPRVGMEGGKTVHTTVTEAIKLARDDVEAGRENAKLYGQITNVQAKLGKAQAVGWSKCKLVKTAEEKVANLK